MEKIIVYALPVFSLLILLEFAWGWTRGRNTYRLNDAISSLSQGLLSQIVGVFTQLFQIGLYALVYARVPRLHHEAFWNAWYGWALALLLWDFCDYWLHRMSHECAILWAAHVVHHQSQDFNFATALRQESAYPLLGWMFYLPMAVLGVPPDTFAVAGLVVLVYQIWIHTEHVGRLGWLDRVFSTPSNHRVHHAVNPQYVDRNYGGMLVVWDRLFGTFAEEREPCVFGTRPPLNSWDPLWAVAAVYWKLAKNVLRAKGLGDKLRVLLKPPGWRPGGAPSRPQAFDPAAVRRYDPPLPRGAACFAAAQFLLVLGATAAFLWRAEDWPRQAALAVAGALLAGLWTGGAVMQGRLRLPAACLIDLAAAAAALWAAGAV